MKILYIHEYFTDSQKNGANIVAFSNYELVKNSGHEVYFYSMDVSPYIEDNVLSRYFPLSHINKKGFINNIIYRVNSVYNVQAKKNLYKILKIIRPDIVHIHSTLELSLSILKPIKDFNIPIVMTVHDAGFVCPVMGGTQESLCTLCAKSKINCIKKKCSKNSYICSIYMTIKFWMNKFLIKKYKPNQLIIPSKALGKYIKMTNLDNAIPINIIPNCLDSEFNNINPNYTNRKYFLFVGTLIDEKGVDILLNVIKNLPNNIKFHIVGSGRDEEKYKDFVIKNKLNNVKFKGKLDRKQLVYEYQNCIALIVPSVLFETFGMINIEAFISGKPVIASNIGGISEIIEHNVNGLLFEPGNVEQLTECILRYWNNSDLVIEHGRQGYQKAKDKYTKESYYDILIKLYEELINE